MHILILIFILIKLTISITIQFSNPLQRFVYHNHTKTILLASINHVYSLNASDLSILADFDTTPSIIDQQCLRTNRNISSKNLYHFSTLSHLTPSDNSTFNQLLLPINDSVLICSTATRGASCQLRSLTNLHFIRNSSERLVSSSPLYPSIGFINQNNQILYLSNPYDSQCDPFYEIPTISGRRVNAEDFLSVLNFNSGQSALQQSTYTLRLLNIRLIKDFFLYYLYGFEYKHFSYFLTIQQADLHHTQKSNLQTKIIRFCQTSKQPIIKSYVELPLTCGKNFHYLITGKFSEEDGIFYGLFRNSTSANSTSTSHAICAYSIVDIQQGFFQTIKRCLVDGKGHRGLPYISPDTHCRASKHSNEIDDDYCPDETEGFSQYPIGGQQAIEQAQPIIQLDDLVNFTAIEIANEENQTIIFLGDDHGTVHTIQVSNGNEIIKQRFPSKIILDLKLIDHHPTLDKAQLLILTDNQIIKQNLSICEQYSVCQECSKNSLCHWCAKENRCTAQFQCTDEFLRNNPMNRCTNIQQVIPEILSLDDLTTEENATVIKVMFNTPLENHLDEYMCRFTMDNQDEFYQTKAVLEKNTINCSPPRLDSTSNAISKVRLSISHLETNATFGSYPLKFLNCSNFQSCTSCTSSSSNMCLWNRKISQCLSQPKENLFFTHYLTTANQCPSMYLESPKTHLTYHVDKTLVIHIEDCHRSLSIHSCRLNDHRKRLALIAYNPVLMRSDNSSTSCSLKCIFQWSNSSQIFFHRPLNLRLSIEFSNETISIIPNTHISLYRCEHLASNCSSCLQLNPSYGCTWCNNQCLFKNHTRKCIDHHRCSSPIIEKIDPLILPMHGGTLVTITGKHFDVSQSIVHLANIPCRIVEEESTENRIVCQSGDAGSIPRTGLVHLKFISSDAKINVHQIISYIQPKIHSIEPLIGIQSGGTILTIHGENFTIGNSHISVFIGNQLCQLHSISSNKIECKTRSFPSSMLNRTHPIELYFDRQTKLLHSQLFIITPNPVLYTFDRYESFLSGGHLIVIRGNNFDPVQNIQLEFHYLIFVSPRFRNNTHLIFLTPAIEQLHLRSPQEILLRIHLDNLNQSSILIYRNDPIIYELQPMLQTYTNRLVIQGMNFTAIDHTKEDIYVHIGCDRCPITHLQSDQIICRPSKSHPKRYSKSNQLCYNSEHPSIILSIDNIHSHVGYLIYPKRIVWLGVLIGCLSTILVIGILVLLIIYLKIGYTKQKYRQDCLYATRIVPQEIFKEKIYSSLFLPIRSYIDYLQMSFSSNHFTSNKINCHINDQLHDQFASFLEKNDQLMDCLMKHSIAMNDDKILNNLILIQRYDLKKLFQYDHHLIYFNTCILTSYDFFSSNHLHSLFSQLYSQLKSKILSGPIDAIESNMSYYSLNLNTIIHEHSVMFKPIQLIVHIDSNHWYSHELLINLSCLTSDTISQVKQKLLSQLNLTKKMSSDQCSLYLLTHSSCSSSSSTASSSVPLIRKSLLTQALFNRTIKYSTTTINDPYRESNHLLLTDIDNTNEQINQWRKLNTLQHYGIATDGYEMKIILPNLSHTPQSSCQYCSPIPLFNYLPLSLSNENHRLDYIHLLNHTYEEIERKVPSETYRLCETKSVIHSVLVKLIENLFTNPIHDETYLSELIKEHRQIFHMFYGHFIPFILRNLHCLFDISMEKSLNGSLEIIAMIFHIACCQPTESGCSLCVELFKNENIDSKIENCTAIFTDEIQRVRVFYSNLEHCLKNETLISVYSTTNTGIDKTFQLDKSIFMELMEYSHLHANEIMEYLTRQSSDRSVLTIFLNFMQMHGNNERT